MGRGGGGGLGHVIFNLHLGVGHSVLCQIEGVGHVFSCYHILNWSGPPPPPCTFWPVPKTFPVVQKVEGYLLGQIILAELREPKGRQAEPHNHIGKRNPCIDFLMITISSGISRGRVRTTTTMSTTTTAESRNMEALLQILG